MQGSGAGNNRYVALFIEIFNMLAQDAFADTGIADDDGKSTLLRMDFDDLDDLFLLW